MTTGFDFSVLGAAHPVQVPKEVTVELPSGLVGNPQAASQCSLVDLSAQRCPRASQVGTVLPNFSQGLFTGLAAQPIYNVVPEPGYPAEFGVYVRGLEKIVLMYAAVGPPPGYRLRVFVPGIPWTAATSDLVVTFFGDPQGMDGGGSQSTAFFTNPSDCAGGPLEMRTEVRSWEELPAEASLTAESSTPAVVGCDQLQFHSSITISPQSTIADEPVDYGVDLQIRQSQAPGLEGRATPPLKDATLTLPQGVSISPGAADGLAACTAEDIAITSAASGNCPLASQVGSVEATTPVLSEPLKGHLYVAAPACGGAAQEPCGEANATNGTLFGLYLELDGQGVVIKQRGTVSVSPATGQLTGTFKGNPQQPFGDLKLRFEGGPQSPLANPQACGGALTTSDMTPWSSPTTPDSTPSWEFAITGCDDSPFAPSFEAGTTYPAAGAYTGFTTTFGRRDRQQDLSAIQVQMPPGLLGTLSHVTLCEEPNAREGTCSSASEIGTATAGAGAGPHPLWVSGPVYLTGPYKGAPFGLSFAIPAKAGPFNLGTVVARATLNIDPVTSALIITSDPLPQIRDGVPLRVQTVNVTVKRSQFMFNPTNCEAKQIRATITSAQGASAQVSSPFAAGGCKNLSFNPGFKASTRAPGSRKRGTGLDVKVTSAPGQANIHSVSVKLPKQLPSRLTTIQQACPEATFTVNPATCPAGSLIGIARGSTPVLPVPVVGPAYLVSHGGAAFPDLKLVLQGDGARVDLTGSINISRGVTSSTFASIPDVPVSSFELRLPEGRYSALTPNGDLCAKPLTMPTTLVGQNGQRLVRTTKIAVAGCPKGARKAAKKRSKAGKAAGLRPRRRRVGTRGGGER
jgi:hypothetical protein